MTEFTTDSSNSTIDDSSDYSDFLLSTFSYNGTLFASPPWLSTSRKPPIAAQEDPSTVIKLVGYWELGVAIIGTPANLLVLYLTLSFLRRGSRRPASASSDRRHQSNLWFIFSMTLSDWFFSSIHAPMMFAQYAFGVKYRAEACLTLYIVTYASTICSSISLLWLNVDKFLYLNQPLHYQTRVTSRRALGAVICAWATSVVWALFFMLGPFTKYTPPCDFRPSPAGLYWYIAFAVGFFVMPTVVSLSVSTYIACVVMRVIRENEARRRTGTVLCSTNSTMSNSTGGRSGGSGTGTTTLSTSASIRTIAFVFTTTFFSAITYLPYRIAYLFYISPIFPSIRKPWSIRASYLLFALLTTNAAGNPFITILTQRQYSIGFMSLLFRKRQYSSNTYSTTDGGDFHNKSIINRRRSSANQSIRMSSSRNASMRIGTKRDSIGLGSSRNAASNRESIRITSHHSAAIRRQSMNNTSIIRTMGSDKAAIGMMESTTNDQNHNESCNLTTKVVEEENGVMNGENGQYELDVSRI